MKEFIKKHKRILTVLLVVIILLSIVPTVHYTIAFAVMCRDLSVLNVRTKGIVKLEAAEVDKFNYPGTAVTERQEDIDCVLRCMKLMRRGIVRNFFQWGNWSGVPKRFTFTFYYDDGSSVTRAFIPSMNDKYPEPFEEFYTTPYIHDQLYSGMAGDQQS
ncbi:MAG: hypothetical protein IIT70_07345 [Clostridia bacterium]|nr:hypothetical protein [Clostridia bacterium]MBQ3937728.1 hypothetical protein [Clostridia bacterium]MBQ5488650.1 hypothetical protein [Clostridia bacterium]